MRGIVPVGSVSAAGTNRGAFPFSKKHPTKCARNGMEMQTGAVSTIAPGPMGVTWVMGSLLSYVRSVASQAKYYSAIVPARPASLSTARN